MCPARLPPQPTPFSPSPARQARTPSERPGAGPAQLTSERAGGAAAPPRGVRPPPPPGRLGRCLDPTPARHPRGTMAAPAPLRDCQVRGVGSRPAHGPGMAWRPRWDENRPARDPRSAGEPAVRSWRASWVQEGTRAPSRGTPAAFLGPAETPGPKKH